MPMISLPVIKSKQTSLFPFQSPGSLVNNIHQMTVVFFEVNVCHTKVSHHYHFQVSDYAFQLHVCFTMFAR